MYVCLCTALSLVEGNKGDVELYVVRGSVWSGKRDIKIMLGLLLIFACLQLFRVPVLDPFLSALDLVPSLDYLFAFLIADC